MRLIIKKGTLEDYEHYLVKNATQYFKLPIEKMSKETITKISQELVDRFMNIVATAEEVKEPNGAYL